MTQAERFVCDFCVCEDPKALYHRVYRFTGAITTDQGNAIFDNARVWASGEDFVILESEEMSSVIDGMRITHKRVAFNVSRITKVCF